MKRSVINQEIREAIAFCDRHDFHLPKWATWPAERWQSVGAEADEVRRGGLGWDVTDFGSGDYAHLGLLAFTIRNGCMEEAKQNPGAKDYCEKLLRVGEGQVTPTHFHWAKMEDIINRAGGRLVIQLWLADPETETLDEEHDLTVGIDGIERAVAPGGTVVLEPGESITLCPYVYHNFYAEKGRGMVLAGEVSRVNDDANDNRFLQALPRFADIDEDEPPAYLLCTEYPEAGNA